MMFSITTFLTLTFVLSQTQAFQSPATHAAATSRTRTQELDYSSTVDAPMPSPGVRARVKQTIQKLVGKTSRKQPTKFSGPANLSVVTTLQEYAKTLAAQQDQLTVVRFHAPWCKACHLSAPLWDRMVKTNPNISFVQVAIAANNKDILHDLGVSKLPFGHIYQGGLKEELNMSKASFPSLAKIVKSYDDKESQLPEIDEVTNIFEAPYIRRC
jgi:thiol-disulfide isomerase/thioredoxin